MYFSMHSRSVKTADSHIFTMPRGGALDAFVGGGGVLVSRQAGCAALDVVRPTPMLGCEKEMEAYSRGG